MGQPVRAPAAVSVLSVVVLLVGAAAAAGFASLDLRRVADRELTEPAPAAGDGVEFRSGGAPPRLDESSLLDQVVPVLLILAALALVLVVVRVLLHWRGRFGVRRGWYRLRSLRPAPSAGPAEPDGAALLAALDEAVARSEDDQDPRRAVIACWVRLEEAAGAAGTPRQDSDTATDLVIRLLRGHQVSEPVLAAFAEAYRLARYASHTVDERMRNKARSALHRLRAELRPEGSSTGGGGAWRSLAWGRDSA